jgi:hypothetical protein
MDIPCAVTTERERERERLKHPNSTFSATSSLTIIYVLHLGICKLLCIYIYQEAAQKKNQRGAQPFLFISEGAHGSFWKNVLA